MAESLIVNHINGKNNFIVVPASSTEAETFASTFLDGGYGVYELFGDSGSDTVAVAPDDINIMFKNTSTGMKSYLTAKVAATVTDEQIFAVLMGLTLNGVLIDEAYVISRKTATRW